MSNYYYTSTDLLKSIKSRIMMPSNQSTFTDQDLLNFATEEMNMAIVPMVLGANEDYYLITEPTPMSNANGVYDIPYRAIGNKLRDAVISDIGSKNIRQLTRINIGDLSFYNGSGGSGAFGINAFYVANNQLVLVNPNVANSNAYTLNMSYYLRPNCLVLNQEVGEIESVDYNTGIITLANYPDSFALATALTKPLDFIQLKSPHKIIAYDVPAFLSTISNTKTITMTIADIPLGLVAGDRIAFATETDIPQIPSDMHVLLAHRVATRVLEALNDGEGLQAANQKLAELQTAALALVHNRVEEAPQKLINFRATLRNGLSRNRFRRF